MERDHRFCTLAKEIRRHVYTIQARGLAHGTLIKYIDAQRGSRAIRSELEDRPIMFRLRHFSLGDIDDALGHGP